MKTTMARSPDLLRLMPDIRAIAEDAGRLALGFFRPGAATVAQVEFKDGGSPVTEADLAVDRYLTEKLRALAPDFGWLSEETDDNADRLSRPFVFIVDPIDGTRAFARGDEDWTIAIGIVENGRSVAGIVHAPVSALTFSAVSGSGATCNGQSLFCDDRADFAEARVAGPRPLIEAVTRSTGIFQKAKRIHSLAYRFAAVTNGTIDAAIAEKNAHDWDLAAVDAIVHEAGGVILTPDGSRPVYNRAETTHDALAAGPPALAGRLARALSLDPVRMAAMSPESKLLD